MGATPIYSALREYAVKNAVRCHTPGHNGQAYPLAPFSQVLPFDVTEIEGFDSLYDANGIIGRSEELTAEVFSAADTLFSSGGCTLAIQTMLALYLSDGDKVAMARNSHRSAVNTAALLNINPVWLYPSESGTVTPETVEDILTHESGIKAVYLTSPDYYGRLCDIKNISKVCHRHSVPLLVDNAHGSHLAFLKENLHPLYLGADMTACSVHKTLPVLTGGALLNIKNSGMKPQAKRLMSLFGSTSPSYLTMASIELATDWLRSDGRKAFALLEEKTACLHRLAKSHDISPNFSLFDPVRLTLHTGKIGVNGISAAALLRKQNIEPDYYDSEFIVFILTPFHTDEQLLRLKQAIKEVAECEKTLASRHVPVLPRLKSVMSIRKAVFSKSEIIDTEKAIGRIAAEPVCPCPPGIPAVIPGECIEWEAVRYLELCGINRIKVVLP